MKQAATEEKEQVTGNDSTRDEIITISQSMQSSSPNKPKESPWGTNSSTDSKNGNEQYEIMALRQAVLEFREEIIQKKKKKQEQQSQSNQGAATKKISFNKSTSSNMTESNMGVNEEQQDRQIFDFLAGEEDITS